MKKIFFSTFILFSIIGYSFLSFVRPKTLNAETKPTILEGEAIYYHGVFVGCDCTQDAKECYCIY